MIGMTKKSGIKLLTRLVELLDSEAGGHSNVNLHYLAPNAQPAVLPLKSHGKIKEGLIIGEDYIDIIRG